MITTENVIRTLETSGFNLPLGSIDPDKNLTDQGLDSLDVANLIFQAEKSYNIKISMEKAALIQTLSELVDHVKNSVE